MMKIVDIACPILCGVLFGFGLLISGMTDTRRVIGFLDVFGEWDPRLAVVMIGAVSVTMTTYAYLRHTGVGIRPKTNITRELILGAVLFGIGWGMSGICPGPAVVLTSTGYAAPMIFATGMIGGMMAYSSLSSSAPTFDRQSSL